MCASQNTAVLTDNTLTGSGPVCVGFCVCVSGVCFLLLTVSLTLLGCV